jgi:DNA-binding PadR family transcriptional regulator
VPLSPAVFFVLFALADGDKHGYAIMQQVQLLSDETFRIGAGTLYTTLQRLLDARLIGEQFQKAEEDNRRRNYRLTNSGRALLSAEFNRLDALVKRGLKNELVPRHVR